MRLKPIATSIMMGIVTFPVAFVAHAGALDYNQGASVARPAAASNISSNTKSQNLSERNQDRSVGITQNVQDSWFNNVVVSGKIYADGSFASRTPSRFSGDGARRYFTSDSTDLNATNVALRYAALLIDAPFNKYTKAHVALRYNGSKFYSNQDKDNGQFFISEAYLQLGNFDETPFYLKAGRQHVNFGKYVHDNITTPFTQLLSQTRADAITIGYVGENGLTASVFGYQGKVKTGSTVMSTARAQANDFGASLGYDGSYQNVGFAVGIDYVNNVTNANYIASGLGSGVTPIITSKIGGLAVQADVNYNQFDGNIRFVGATQRANMNDLTFNNGSVRPYAAGAEVGYSFNILNDTNSRASLGYQATGRALGLQLPKDRWQVQYAVDLWKNAANTASTVVAVQYNRDKDYSKGDTASFGAGSTTGTGNTVNVVTLRLGANFA